MQAVGAFERGEGGVEFAAVVVHLAQREANLAFGLGRQAAIRNQGIELGDFGVVAGAVFAAMGEVGIGLAITRPDLDGAPVMARRLGETAQILQRVGEIVVRLGVVRAQFDRAPGMGDGVLGPAQVAQYDGEVVLGLGKFGPAG